MNLALIVNMNIFYVNYCTQSIIVPVTPFIIHLFRLTKNLGEYLKSLASWTFALFSEPLASLCFLGCTLPKVSPQIEPHLTLTTPDSPTLQGPPCGGLLWSLFSKMSKTSLGCCAPWIYVKRN